MIDKEIIKQPSGFYVDDQALYAVGKDGGKRMIMPMPLYITKNIINNDSDSFFVELTFRVGNRDKAIVVERNMINNSRSLQTLANCGLMVTAANAKDIVNYLFRYQCDNMELIPSCVLTARTGWDDNGEFIPVSSENVILDSSSARALRGLYDKGSLVSSGTVKDWIGAMIRFRSNPKFRFLLAASFAAPLLHLVGCRNFIISIWGDSQSGKTTAALAVLSVWGDPDKLRASFNATANAIEMHASAFNDMPILLDERQSCSLDAQQLERLLYKIANGEGRKRLTRDAVMRETMNFRNITIVTGEVPLVSEFSNDGVRSRIIELEGSPFASSEDAYTLRQVLQMTYGHAGKVFIDLVRSAEEQRYIKSRYAELVSKLNDVLGIKSAARSQCLAVVELADELASTLFFGESCSEAKAHAWACIMEIANLIQASEPQNISRQAGQCIFDWVMTNKHNFDIINSQKKDATIFHQGQYYGFIDEADSTAFILPAVFDTVLEKRFDVRKTKRDFYRYGYIEASVERAGDTEKTRYTVIVRPPCERKSQQRRFIKLYLNKIGSCDATDFYEIRDTGGLVLEDTTKQKSGNAGGNAKLAAV